jgi:hypothetical protein
MARLGIRSVALVVLGVLCFAATASGASTSSLEGRWLGLGGGDVGAFHWSVEAKRSDGAGPRAKRSPCLLVGTTWRTGPYSYRRSQSRQCAGASGLSPTDAPLVARGVQPSSGESARLTAVGMIFAPAVRRLRATMPDGSTKTLRLSRLRDSDAQAAGLAPFRYAAFTAHGEWCAERLVAEAASGRVLWDSGDDGYACGDSGPPRFAG